VDRQVSMAGANGQDGPSREGTRAPQPSASGGPQRDYAYLPAVAFGWSSGACDGPDVHIRMLSQDRACDRPALERLPIPTRIGEALERTCSPRTSTRAAVGRALPPGEGMPLPHAALVASPHGARSVETQPGGVPLEHYQRQAVHG
jgi:hypothetical protein